MYSLVGSDIFSGLKVDVSIFSILSVILHAPVIGMLWNEVIVLKVLGLNYD